MMESAKEQWFYENNRTIPPHVTRADLAPYMIERWDHCPVYGDKYMINPVGENAVCPNAASYPTERGIEKERVGLFRWRWKVRATHELTN